MSASPGRAPSVMSGLRMSVQPVKPISPIERMSERKFDVFSAHKIFMTWRAPFSCTISDFKFLAICLMSMCSVHCLRQPRGACVSLSLEVGNTLSRILSGYAKANCIAIFWTGRPHSLGSCHFRGV